MLVVVAYDVSTADAAGEKRLRRVAKICERHGQRVQHSVFECLVDAATYVKLKAKLESVIDDRCDTLRFYNLGDKYQPRIEVSGLATSFEPEGFLSL